MLAKNSAGLMLRICLSVVLFALLAISCGKENKSKRICNDYLEKVADCTFTDAEVRQKYLSENSAACEDVSVDSWNYQKIYPCRKEKECSEFLNCVNENTSREPESDGDFFNNSSDGDSSGSCEKKCTCKCSCGDSTLTSIDGCLDCIADCESECENFCGD